MTRLVAITVVLLALPASALAQGDSGETKPKEDDKGEMRETGSAKGRMTLPGGKFMLTVVGEANMAKDVEGKPLSVAPDLFIGVADRLTFAIVHSGRAATGFLTSFGTGLCFRGEIEGLGDVCSFGLGEVYTFGGGELRLGLTEGAFAVALVGGVHARAFDPELVLSARGGLIVRLHSSRVALELAPSAYIGMTQRDFNPDQFGAPVTLYFRLAGGFSLALQSGVTFNFKELGDTWRIPAAAGFVFWVSPKFAIDAAFGLAAVADADDMTKAFDARSASLGVSLAL